MPLQPTNPQIRFNNILTALSAAVATFEVVADSLKASCLEPTMLEHIHEVLYAIIHIHIHSETGGELSPNMLNHMGKFTETLHKIHTFVEAQQEKSRIMQFFRQGKMSTLLKGCHLGLEEALKAFKVQNIYLSSDVAQMQDNAQKRHQEILEMISALSDGISSDKTSTSIFQFPKQVGTPGITMLGGGGMGKTSLARAVLHHPDIAARYEQQCPPAARGTTHTSVQLAALIGAHLGLKPSKNLTQAVIHHFSNSSPSLLVLDNLETVWEPIDSRGEVEKFLAFFAGVDHLTLIITMCGAERPANVQWSHPLLGPLKPLTHDAARKTVIGIIE
ncbi:hypothetical protein DFH09DRAFT_1079827 [Mycena vulgaris]|nr:hypothetical protein DFH09DRAFT_1079827 [Mycena vulgaris]